MLLSVLAGLGHATREARSEKARWGTTIDVVVARATAQPGSEVAAARPYVVARPRAVVVDDAVRAQPAPSTRLRLPVRPGDVLTARHLVAAADRLPPDDRAMAIPTGRSTPPLQVGDAVDLVLVSDPFGDETTSSQAMVASVVLAVDADEVTVRVPVDRVVAVVRAAAHGEVAVVRR